jgi:hypothetical protein
MTDQSSSEARPIQATVVLTEADIEEGLSSLPRARATRLLGALTPIAVAVLLLYRWQEERDRTLLAGVAILMVLALLFLRNPVRRLAHRVFASLPEAARRFELRIDEQGVVIISSTEESPLPWSEIWRVRESKKSFMLFVSRQDAQILPKRSLTSEDIARIRTLAARQVRPHKEPWLTPELRRRLLLWALVIVVASLAMYFAQNR